MTPGEDHTSEGRVRDWATEALAGVRERIAAASERANRSPDAVTLIGVSKTVNRERVAAMGRAGLVDFGENRAADLAAKMLALGPELRWHFLGKLQRGTVKSLVGVADVVHSGEPGPAVERLARRVSEEGGVVDILAQVDFTGRRQGTSSADLPRFVEHLHTLEGLRPVGLMTLPPQTATPDEARPYFVRLREQRDALVADWPGMVELSMGMSADYEVAVEEGATMVRVGTALFGGRATAPKG